MRSYSLLLLAVFSGLVIGDDLFGMRLTTESSQKKESTQYRFHYFVKDDTTGDYKVQQEIKQGDLVHGSYTLAEPNGDLRTVTYKAGPGKGFEAKVDVHTSGSPMKQTTKETPVSQITTAPEIVGRTEKPMMIESTIKPFPGAFKMDVLSKPSDTKTEMGMQFSLKANTVTTPVTVSSDTDTVFERKVSEEPVTKTTNSVSPKDGSVSTAVENSTFPTEGREISEEEIEKEIDEVINSMPKLPELVLSDNKTRFIFHKDPEEALLDERITQIARQLAETSLRREYEERKLGHFIPFSVSSVKPSTSRYLSKSFKYTKNNLSNFRPYEPSTLHVLTQLKIVPQYIYKQTVIPKLFSVNHRLPIASKLPQVTKSWETPIQETITNPPDALKINKSGNNLKEINQTLQEKGSTTVDKQPVSLMPFHIPTLIQFFSPYVMHNSGSYIASSQSDPLLHESTVKKDFMIREVPVSEDMLFAHVTMVNDHSTEKP